MRKYLNYIKYIVMQASNSSKISTPFQQAELHVSALVEALQSDKQADAREKDAVAIVQTRLIDDYESPEAVYLGCLLKAYIHVLTHEAFPPENLAQDLVQFINGEYEVSGTHSVWANTGSKTIRPEAQLVTKEHIENATHDVVAIDLANHLAFTAIFECELAKQFDANTAKKLAASTSRLLVPRHYYTDKGFDWRNNRLDNLEVLWSQKIFADSLLQANFNPFENARVLEFAGHDHAIKPEYADNNMILKEKIHFTPPFPMIRLFKQYLDYTPSTKYIIKVVGDPDYINLENPGAFFSSAKHWNEDRKFDYVIAANVFCDGAVEDHSGRDAGYYVYSDLVPHFSNCLKNHGKMIISNVQMDPMDVVGWHAYKGYRDLTYQVNDLMYDMFQPRVTQHERWNAAQAINALLRLQEPQVITEQNADTKDDFNNKLIAGIAGDDRYKPNQFTKFLRAVKCSPILEKENPLNKYEPLECGREFKMRGDEDAGLKVHSASSNGHLAVLGRNYRIRPNVPITIEERKHDWNIPEQVRGTAPTFLQKLEEKRDAEIMGGAGAGWDVDL